ncbi:MAG TPA: hypothetical protein VFE53_03080 [Mucilaginibacter sp.]|jgi:hypothetical protein|nr:hypothetical protein [Mucilaginibacter sp.]
MITEIELQPGQNLRYTGNGFPGYIKGQPYMVFQGHLNKQKIIVSYNDRKVLVNKRNISPVK